MSAKLIEARQKKERTRRRLKTKTFADLKKESGYERPIWGKKSDRQIQLEAVKGILAAHSGKGGKFKGFRTVEEYQAHEAKRAQRGAREKLVGLNIKVGGDEFASSIPGDAGRSLLQSPYNSPSSSPRAGPSLVRTVTPLDWSVNPKTRTGKGGKGRTERQTRSQYKSGTKARTIITIPDSDDEDAPKRPTGGSGGGGKPPPGGGRIPSAPVKPPKKKNKIEKLAATFGEDDVDRYLRNPDDFNRLTQDKGMSTVQAIAFRTALKYRQAAFKARSKAKAPTVSAHQQEKAKIERYIQRLSEHQIDVLLSNKADLAQVILYNKMSTKEASRFKTALRSRQATFKAKSKTKAVATKAVAAKAVATKPAETKLTFAEQISKYDLPTIDRYLSNKGWLALVQQTGINVKQQQQVADLLRKRQAELKKAKALAKPVIAKAVLAKAPLAKAGKPPTHALVLKQAKDNVDALTEQELDQYLTKAGWAQLVKGMNLGAYEQHILRPMMHKRRVKLRRAALKAMKKAGKQRLVVTAVDALKAGKQKQKARQVAYQKLGVAKSPQGVAARLARAEKRQQTNLELHRLRKERQAAYRKKKAQSRQGVQISERLDVAKLQIRQTGPKSYSVRSTGMSPQVNKHVQLLLDRLSGKLFVNQKLMSKKSAYNLIVRLLTERKTVSVQIQ